MTVLYSDVYPDLYGDLYGVPFPLAPLDVRTEINVGGWADITTPYVLQRDGTSPPISITRGRPNEQAAANACSMSAQWNNRSGNLSPRNPTGTWYGLLGRNTPVRVSVPNPAGPALRVADDAASGASCPSSAGLLFTGDIDARIDVDLDNWAPCFLMGQWAAGAYCWALSLAGNGSAVFTWYDGTVVNQVSSTMPVPLGRVTIRAWFDPAGSSGSPEVLFYTAPTMSGGFAQLGNAVAITSADTAYSTTTPLLVGYSAAWASSTATYGMSQPGLQGRVYEAQAWNGFTLAADPQFYAQAAGVASFADAQGNTWTPSGSATVDNRAYRVHAECTTLPQRWDPTGSDVWCPVEAKGVLQRLQQGSSPVPSVMRRSVGVIAANPQWNGIHVGSTLAYWPCEDAQGSTQIASGLPGGQPMAVSGAAGFQGATGSPSADSALPCSAQLAQPASSAWTGQIPVTPAAAAAASSNLYLLLYVPSGVANATLAVITLAGGGVINLLWSSGALSAGWLSPTGGTGATGAIGGAVAGTPMWLQVNACQSAATATVTALTAAGAVAATMPITGAISSAMTSVVVNPLQAALGGTEIGHIWAVTSPFSGPNPPLDFGFSYPWPNILTAWNSEKAGNRVLRLLGENGVAARVYGYPNLTMPMGPQPVDTLANLLQAIEVADRGQVYEPAEALGVGYRTLGSMTAQAAQLTLNYAAGQLGDGSSLIEPTDDDQYSLNDVTAQRNNGSSSQFQVTSGPMSIQAPPNGIGDYDTSVTVYNAWDKDLANIASWIASVGTANAERYPAIPLNLARPQLAALQAQIVAMRLGGYFQIQNLISQMPPGIVSQLLFGYSENIGGFHWRISLNGVPEDPYAVAVAGAARAATAGSQLASAVSATATTLSIATTAGEPWVTGGMFPAGGTYVANVFSVPVTCVGAGGGGGSGQTGGNKGGGAGGGETAYEPALKVTPGFSYVVVVGAAGAGGTTGAGAAGGGSSMAGDLATVTAHGGSPGSNSGAGGAGGTGSTNTAHFNGGAGGSSGSSGDGGGGGGASAATTAVGFAGASAATSAGASGGAQGSGYGPGGNGGAALTGPGLAPASGFGGGGGGAGGNGGGNGGGGAGGLVIIGNADFPFNIMMGGEEMTVLGISGASSPQAFFVQRSVNGVVKAQAANTAVQVYPPPPAALAGNR